MINIYIPIGDFKDINMDVLNPLENCNVHLIYEKKENVLQKKLPRVREDFETLKKQKNRILKLGSECGDPYFIMMDSDILHISNGIEKLISYVTYDHEVSAVGIYPYFGKFVEKSSHVSSACMIIKSSDVKDLYLDYNYGCFCSALIYFLNQQGKQAVYLQEQNLVKHLSKGESYGIN